jgi:hypothetical protein
VGGWLMLAALLGLEVWFARSVVHKWPRWEGGIQGPTTDLANFFGSR